MAGTILDWFKITDEDDDEEQSDSDADFVINTKDNAEKNDNANDNVIVLD